MLGKPGVVEPQSVGSNDLVRHACVHALVRVGLAILVRVGREENSEFHALLRVAEIIDGQQLPMRGFLPTRFGA